MTYEEISQGAQRAREPAESVERTSMGSKKVKEPAKSADRQKLESRGVLNNDRVSVKVVPHATDDGTFQLEIGRKVDADWIRDKPTGQYYGSLDEAYDAAEEVLKESAKKPPKKKEKEKEPKKGQKIKLTEGQPDLSDISDDQLRRLAKENPEPTYGSGDKRGTVATAIQAEIVKRGIKKETPAIEQSEKADELLTAWTNLENLKDTQTGDLRGANADIEATKAKLFRAEANARSIPSGRGKYGFSAAKPNKSKMDDAEYAANKHPDLQDAKDKAEDAKTILETTKDAVKAAEKEYYREAGQSFPKIPIGQLRESTISDPGDVGRRYGKTRVTVKSFDEETGMYTVHGEYGGGDYEISAGALNENFSSLDEITETTAIKDRIQEAIVERNAKEADKERKKQDKKDKAHLKELRKAAVDKGKEARVVRDVEEAAKAIKAATKADKKVEITYEDQDGETHTVVGEKIGPTLAIVKDERPGTDSDPKVTSKTDLVKRGHALVHIPSKQLVMSETTGRKAKIFVQLSRLQDVDWDKIEDVSKANQGMSKGLLAKLLDAADTGDYRDLPNYEAMEDAVEGSPTATEADMVLSADDLGGHGKDPHRGMSHGGWKFAKKMREEVPEFMFNPVFTANDKNQLVYKDWKGFEITLTPEIFNLHPSELSEGMTVGLNLEDMGLKQVGFGAKPVSRATPGAASVMSIDAETRNLVEKTIESKDLKSSIAQGKKNVNKLKDVIECLKETRK